MLPVVIIDIIQSDLDLFKQSQFKVSLLERQSSRQAIKYKLYTHRHTI